MNSSTVSYFKKPRTLPDGTTVEDAVVRLRQPNRTYCDKFPKSIIGLRNSWIKNYSDLLSGKISNYVLETMCAERTDRQQEIAQTLLKRFNSVLEQKASMADPKTRVHKAMVLVADRLSLWLDKNVKVSRETAQRMRELEEMEKKKMQDDEKRKLEEEMRKREKEMMAEEEEEMEAADKGGEDKPDDDHAGAGGDKKPEETEGEKKGEAEVPVEDATKEEKTTAEEDEKKEEEEGKIKPTDGEEGEEEKEEKEEPKGEGQGKGGAEDEGEKAEMEPEKADEIKEGEETQPGDAEVQDQAETTTEPEAIEETVPDQERTEEGKEAEGSPERASDEPTEEQEVPAETPLNEDITPAGTEPEQEEVEKLSAGEEEAKGDEHKEEEEEEEEIVDEGIEEITDMPDEIRDQDQVVPSEEAQRDETEEVAPEREGEAAQEISPERAAKIEEVIKSVASMINEVKTTPSARQEALKDVMEKELEKELGDKHADAIGVVASKVGTWIDQSVKTVEQEYGDRERAQRLSDAQLKADELQPSQILDKTGMEYPGYHKLKSPVAQRPKGRIFNVRKMVHDQPEYDVTLITHTKAKQKIGEARGKTDFKFDVPNPNDALQPKDLKSWAEWASRVSEMAKNWANWIEDTVKEAQERGENYKKTDLSKELEQDWESFKESKSYGAHKWKKNKKQVTQQAELWSRKSTKVNTGN